MDAITIERNEIGTPTRTVRRYSDEDRAKALIALDVNSGNLLKTSRQLDIPIMTLSQWRNGRVSSGVTKACNEIRAPLADLCEDAAYEFVEQARATIEYSKGTQAATGAAIFIDKMRLLRGESTVNISQSHTEAAQLMANFLKDLHDHASRYNEPMPPVEFLEEYARKFAAVVKVEVEPKELIARAERLLSEGDK